MKLVMHFVNFGVLVALLCSCKTIIVPDEFACINLPNGGGFCKTLISGVEMEVDEPYWSTCMGPPNYPEHIPCVGKSVLISPKSIGKYVSTIESVCNHYQNCEQGDPPDTSKKVKENISVLESRMLQ